MKHAAIALLLASFLAGGCCSTRREGSYQNDYSLKAEGMLYSKRELEEREADTGAQHRHHNRTVVEAARTELH